MMTGEETPRIRSDWHRDFCSWACWIHEDVSIASSRLDVKSGMFESSDMMTSLR